MKIGFLFFIAIAILSYKTHAQEPQACDSCSGYPSGSYMRSSGTQPSGIAYRLSCRSNVWMPLIEGDLPCGCSPTIGSACNDGSVYVGLSPDGNVPMYMTTAAHQTTGPYGGSVQTGNPRCDAGGTAAQCRTGESNTAALAALTTAQTVPRFCENLTAHGHSDWFLPSRAEIVVMQQYNNSVGGDFSNNEYYFSSSESHGNYVWTVNISTGHIWPDGFKGNALPARCVRK